MLEKTGSAMGNRGGCVGWGEEVTSNRAKICSNNPTTSKATTGASELYLRKFSLLRFLGLASMLLPVHGQRTDSFPAQFDLSSLDGTNGIVVKGEKGQERSAKFVSSAGDFNGDGIDDFVIGAHFQSPNSIRRRAGKTYIIFGSRDLGKEPLLQLSNLNSTNSIVFNGEEADDNSGFSVSLAGDINGDGAADILIGAPRNKNKFLNGMTYVLFGGRGFSSSFTSELSDLNGTTGCLINGEQPSDRSGDSVSYAGDVNGDGTPDIIIGAYNVNPAKGREMAGRSYVIFGSANLGSNGTLELSSLNGINGFVLNGEGFSDHSGTSVSSAGDVNGDGTDDLLIGASNANPALNQSNAGKTYVIFGGSGLGSSGILELSSLDGTNGFVLNGERENDHSGISVSRAGDVNGDGTDDLVVGAYRGYPVSGRVGVDKTYVIFGGGGLGRSGVLELSSLNGLNGFVLIGDMGEHSGRTISYAGDVNGDGIDDLIIGARFAAPSIDKPEAGKTYVVFGSRKLGSSGTLEISSLDGMTGFILNGEHAYDLSGAAVSSAGDVNGDGIADLIVGAPGKEKGSPPLKAYVVFGRDVTQNLTPHLLASSSIPTSISLSTPPQDSHIASAPNTPHTPFTPLSTSAKSLSNVASLLPKTPPTPSSDVTPVYIGISVSVTAFCCSLLAGGLLYAKRIFKRGPYNNEQPIALNDQVGSQSQVYDHVEKRMDTQQNYGSFPQDTDYHKAPAPGQIYDPVDLEAPSDYQVIDNLKRTQECDYDSPHSPLE